MFLQFVAILAGAFNSVAMHYGIGRHIFYVAKDNPENVLNTFKWLWASEPTNLTAVYLVRLSICLFFLRLVPKKDKRYRWTIISTIIFCSIAEVYVAINYFIECRPIEKVWNKELKGSCVTGIAYQFPIWFYQGLQNAQAEKSVMY